MYETGNLHVKHDTLGVAVFFTSDVIVIVTSVFKTVVY